MVMPVFSVSVDATRSAAEASSAPTGSASGVALITVPSEVEEAATGATASAEVSTESRVSKAGIGGAAS